MVTDYVSQLKPCSECGSSDLVWCGISVRPYCRECNHWGGVNYGPAEEAIMKWNDTYDRVQTQEKLEHARLPNNPQPTKLKLYHVTTPKKVQLYHHSQRIIKPVRGFTTLTAALAWACKTSRTVILEIAGTDCHKLPDHHNQFGEAWWIDHDITEWKCVFSPKDA